MSPSRSRCARALELRERYATQGGFKAVVIRLRLPDGRIYDQIGKLNFVNNTIAQNTDTITLRGDDPQSDPARICPTPGVHGARTDRR